MSEKSAVNKAKDLLQEAERILWKEYATARPGSPHWGENSPGEQAYKLIFEANDLLVEEK